MELSLEQENEKPGIALFLERKSQTCCHLPKLINTFYIFYILYILYSIYSYNMFQGGSYLTHHPSELSVCPTPPHT